MKKALVTFAVLFLGAIAVVGTSKACPGGGKGPSQPMSRAL